MKYYIILLNRLELKYKHCCINVNIKGLPILKRTFCHLHGIGLKKETTFWKRGIFTWDHFIHSKRLDIPEERRDFILKQIKKSKLMLTRDPLFFTNRMDSKQHWRIFPSFRKETVYLDIETTGPSPWSDDISAVTLFDGKTCQYFVLNENMQDLPAALEKFKVIVTYNGKSFDIPYIENYFSIKCTQVHIDLRYIMADLGYKGGLKGCEKAFGMDRGDLDGVDGYAAVLLWKAWKKTRDIRYKEMLIAYNAADSINLEHLMVRAYNEKSAALPCGKIKSLSLPKRHHIPYKIHRSLLSGLYKRNRWD